MTRSCVLLAAVLLAVTAPPSHAGTWTINGTIVNNTSSSAACGTGAPPGYVGCIQAGAGALDDGTLSHDGKYGAAPASFTPAAGGSNRSTFEFFAPYLARGADQYTPLTMPDGSVYVITAEDDDDPFDGITGNYAGCAEVADQGSQYVCTAQWSGTTANPQLTFTFGPSEDAPVASVGQRCTAELGGSSPGSIDCATGGGISHVVPFPGGLASGTQLYSRGTPAVYVQTTDGGNCRMAGYGDTCWLATTDTSDITMAPLDPSQQNWFSVEVVGVSNGPYAGLSPNTVPDVGDVEAHVTALSVVPPRAVAGSASAPRRAAKRSRARIVYRTDRNASTVFRLARARPAGHGRTRWARVGERSVQSSRTLTGVRRRTFRVRGLFGHRGSGRRRSTVRVPIALAPGRYRLSARARAHGAGVTGPARRVTFTVPPPS